TPGPRREGRAGERQRRDSLHACDARPVEPGALIPREQPMNAYTKPIPAISDDMRPFYTGAKRHELWMQRCRSCGVQRFPARAICSSCLSTESEWVPVSGRGEIFSFNVMHQVYHPG